MSHPKRTRSLAPCAMGVAMLLGLTAALAGIAPAHAAPPLARRGWPAERLVGSLAPAIDARATDGTAVSLASRRGRVVVLEFWATWCGACRSIVPQMEELHRDYERRGISVLAVSDEPIALVASFQQRMRIRYPIAGEGARAAHRYRVQALPTLVLIDRTGTVRDVSVGLPPQGFDAIEARAQAMLGSGFRR